MKWSVIILLITVSIVSARHHKWLKECLEAHNEARASHGKPPLKLNKKITRVAQDYADKLSAECAWTHSNNPKYGENLSAGTKSCKVAVSDWMKEESEYDPSNPVYSDAYGHYTQVVWKATSQLGCGLATHCKYGWVTVCNYYTPGNYDGEFEANV